MNRSEITAILASAALRPQHKFGQNFMIDQNILRAIAAAGEITGEDTVLEIGPGVGNLTRLLAERAGAVVAVDIDAHLLEAARRHHAALANVEWLRADVLAGKHEINAAAIERLVHASRTTKQPRYKLVSNLPYNAASPVVAELLVLSARHLSAANGTVFFSLLAFTVQYEVAERMAAKPNTRDYGPLGILIQLTAEVEILRKIPPGAFWPPPKVNSALVRIRPRRELMERIPDILTLQKLLSGVFSHRRQTLHNALKHHLGDRYSAELKSRIESAGIDLKLRPEVLAPHDFVTLTNLVTGH